MSLSDRIERVCQAFSARTAFLEEGKTPVSFANLFLALLRFAEKLQDSGVRPGDHVVVATREPISVTLLKLALMRIGSIPIAVGPAMAAENGPIKVDWVIQPAQTCTGQRFEIGFDRSWIGPPTRRVPVIPGGGVIHATSGTTGIPKLRWDDEAVFLARINNGLAARGALDGPVFVAQNVGSLIGLKSILTGLLETQPVMTMLSSPEETVRKLTENRIMHAFIPPLHLRRLVEAAEAEKLTTPFLTRINVGGGALSGEFAARCETVFGCEIYTDYGSTETDTIASYRASLTRDTPGLVGPIWAGFEYRFQTLDGDLAQPETGGELFLKVPAHMRTRNYPEAVDLFDADGWISTGDMGHMTEAGHLILSGRKSDLINVGGNKLAPAMLEEAARGHEPVRELAAFRVPTDSGIDAIGFGVVADESFDEGAFLAHLNLTIGSLYDFRVLRLESIPITETGKVNRKALEAALQGG